MTEEQPLWSRILFSLVPLLIGLIIVGAWFGIIPADGRTLRAPAPVILALAGTLILFAFLIWVPSGAPRALKVALPVMLLLLLAVVCNWTAFAPGVRYASELSVGPWSWAGEDQMSGRVVFGLAAVAVDAVMVAALFQAVRSWLRRR